MNIKRTEDEIDDQITLAWDHDFRGMTYAEGVRAALDWVTGYTDELPFDPADL